MPGENAAQGVATTANPAPRSCLLIAGDSATLLQGRRCCNLPVQKFRILSAAKSQGDLQQLGG